MHLLQFTKNAKPFAFWGQHDDFVLILPPSIAEEIKHVGPEKLNFLQAVEDVLTTPPQKQRKRSNLLTMH